MLQLQQTTGGNTNKTKTSHFIFLVSFNSRKLIIFRLKEKEIGCIINVAKEIRNYFETTGKFRYVKYVKYNKRSFNFRIEVLFFLVQVKKMTSDQRHSKNSSS
jgi:hypothetical protein